MADLWAPDGTAELPFAVGASPRRLEGREAVRSYLAGYPDLYDVRTIPALTVHHTGDASTIVAEFSARTHGRRLSLGCVTALRPAGRHETRAAASDEGRAGSVVAEPSSSTGLAA